MSKLSKIPFKLSLFISILTFGFLGFPNVALAATTFMEAGTDSTFDLPSTLPIFYDSMDGGTGTVTSATDQLRTGPRTIAVNSSAGNAAAYVQKNTALADAGRRITIHFRFANLPGSTTRIIDANTSADASVVGVQITSGGYCSFIQTAPSLEPTARLYQLPPGTG